MNVHGLRNWRVSFAALMLACSSTGEDVPSEGAGGGDPAGRGGNAALPGGATSAGGTVLAAGGGGTAGGASSGGVASGGAAPAAGGSAVTGGGPSTGGAASSGGTASTGGAPGPGGMASTCAIRTLDAANPPKALALTGNLGSHDPSLLFVDGVYHQFATGSGIGVKTSTDLLAWKGAPDVFSSIPSWVSGQVSGVTNIWAPDISYFGGTYHLYYSVSTFGTNRSCIGQATRVSMSSGAWADQGSVICSNVGTTDNFNTIDPNVIVDEAGTPWLAFGSFWSGIKMTKLDAAGKRSGTALSSLASNKSIEGPFIVHQCGYYYLFVSFGRCCSSPYDYDIRVGRSKNVTGPYTDKAGTDMMNGGGTLLVEGNGTWTAPGHNAILVTPTGTYNAYHALDSNHARPTLRISELVLDAGGWPVSGGP